MSFRRTAGAVAVVAACALFAPAAIASPESSPAPAQVTGKQLSKGLLPPSHFLPRYVTIYSGNSGGSLEHSTARSVPPMDCFIYWASIGVDQGYGETAFADESAGNNPRSPFSVDEIFHQAAYQFARTGTASSFFGQISAKFTSCKVVTRKDTHGFILKQVVHARKALRVGGHKSLQITEYLTDSQVAGPPLVTYWLFTVYGTNVYIVNSTVLGGKSPQPTLSSLMLKLIARVRALK